MINRPLINETLRKLQDILEKLRIDTGAGRATVRLDHPGLGVNVNSPAAESLAEGVHSIKSQSGLDQWNCAAIKWLVNNRRTFVMDDCLNPWAPDVVPERPVIETYGILSEMLTPVLKDDKMIGWVSVHYTRGPRKWTEEEIKRIESAAGKIQSTLEDFDRLR